MCTSPKIIKNPRKHFIAGIDREYLRVPCGKCFECRNKKRNEIYVLSYYEHLQAVSKGGFTQFFTLTYANNYLPTHGFRPCFSRSDIREYLTQVNSASKRKFGSDFSFRYLIVCEYGHDKHRPHYHFLFFSQANVNKYEFRLLLRRYWPYGWSFGSFDNFGVINRPEGIRYVTKYVSKDMFDMQYDDDKLSECREYSEAAYQSAKKVMPFYWKSKGFGRFCISHILDDFSALPVKWRTPLDVLLNNKLIIPCLDGKPNLIDLPRSIQRMLFFKCNYRYRKVTPLFRENCEIRGTKVPKHRVESHYVPTSLYPVWKKNLIKRSIEKDIENVQVIDKSSAESVAFYRWLSPDYTSSLKVSVMSPDEYVDKVIDVMMQRSPLYYRCPFDKNKFLVERFEMDIDRVPECVDFLNFQYDSSKESISRSVDNFVFKFQNARKVSNDILEKVYRDNKTLKYNVKLQN